MALYAVWTSQRPCHLFAASHQVTDRLGCLLCSLLGRHYYFQRQVGGTPFPPTYCPVAHSSSQSLALLNGQCFPRFFPVAEVDYLGHHIDLGQVQARAKKVQAVVDFPAPTTRRQLQQFLGLAGYYRKFVPHFGHILAALSDLLKKGTKFVWTVLS